MSDENKDSLPDTLFGRPIKYTDTHTDVSGEIIKLGSPNYIARVKIETIVTIEDGNMLLQPKHEKDKVLFKEMLKSLLDQQLTFSIGYKPDESQLDE